MQDLQDQMNTLDLDKIIASQKAQPNEHTAHYWIVFIQRRDLNTGCRMTLALDGLHQPGTWILDTSDYDARGVDVPDDLLFKMFRMAQEWMDQQERRPA